MKFSQLNEGPVTIDKDDKLASLRVIDPNNRRHDDSLNEYSPKQIKMAFGILNDPRYRDGNYDGAYRAIEKIAKGLASHPSVANALRRANESFEGKVSPYFTKKESVTKENIYAKNKEDPMNPEVLIQGFGRLMLNQIEDDLVRKFESLADMAKKKDWDGIDYRLNQSGVVQAFIEAIRDTYEELEQIRRRGGMNSRGIKQR